MNLKRIASMLIFSSLFSVAYASDTKVTVVESRKLIESSHAHKDILEQVQKKNDEFRDEIQKSEAILKKEYQDLENKKNALAQSAMDKKNEEISQKVAELQKTSYSHQAVLEDAYRTATQSVVDKTFELVKKQAEKNGYNIVIEKAAVIYSDAALDITESILEEVNKTLPKVEVKFNNSDKKDTSKEK